MFENTKMSMSGEEQKGRSRKAGTKVKNVRAERELEGKLPPYSTYLFLLYDFIFFVFYLLFFCLRKRRC
jgi:hypothetical protein